MGTKLFLRSVQEGKIEQVGRMLEDEPELASAQTENGLSGLLLAAYYGQQQIARILANHRTDLTFFEARLLLDHGADPNACQAGNFAPLHNAFQNGQFEMIELLLNVHAQVNPRASDSRTPLTFALEAKHSQVADLLRQHGATE